MHTDKISEVNNNRYVAGIDKLVAGTAGFGGLWGAVNMAESVDTILYALENGINAFDTAPAYNNAEKILGKALRQWKGAKPSISTKAGKLEAKRPDINLYDFSPEGLKKSVYTSLEVLGVEYVDILFLHEPSAIKSDEVNEVFNTLLYLKEEGFIKSIGIGGNFTPDFHQYISAEIFDVFMGYNRLNPVCKEALTNEFLFLQKKNIKIWQASPLYMGLLGSRFKLYTSEKPEWIPVAHIAKAKLLKQFCDDNNIELPELAIRYLQSIPAIEKIVIGASSLQELKKTIQYWKQGKLSDKLIEMINQL